MMNVLWLVGMLFASQWGWSAPAPNNTEKGLLGGGVVGSGNVHGALVGGALGAAVGGVLPANNRIVACWDAHVHVCDDAVNPRTKLSMLKGSVYLHCGQTNKSICANGTMLVEACDRDGRKLAQWQFDAATLEKLKRTDLIGVGYTLCLPLDQRCLTEKDLRLTLKFSASDGKTCCAEPTRVLLRSNPEVIQAVHLQPVPARDERKDAQLEFTVILAHVKSSAANRAKLAFNEEIARPNVDYGVVKDKNALLASLQAMRTAGEAKILAEPRIRTLNAKPAHVLSGGEVPVVQTNAQGISRVSYQPHGIQIKLSAMVLGDSKLLLDVGTEISQLDPSLGLTTANPLTIIPGMRTKSSRVSIQVRDGQTLYVFQPKFNTEKGQSEDLIILVTVRAVEPTCPVATPKANRQMTFTEIVTLSKRGISDHVIIRQIELTESIYDLTTEQILSLHENSVSNGVIRAMQERRASSRTRPATPPAPFVPSY